MLVVTILFVFRLQCTAHHNMANAERKRAKNLTKQDVELLTDLVFRFKHIIENKKTDAITVKQKNDAWETISDEFSASASHPRNAEQLKNYYKNTKSNLKNWPKKKLITFVLVAVVLLQGLLKIHHYWQ